MSSQDSPANGVLIVGAGQAASELATALRQLHYPGRIVMVGDEPHVPYRRPPLSKAFLAGQVSLDSLYLKSPSAYEAHGIECRTPLRIASIDRGARRALLSDGTVLHYDKLALTTGGRARPLGLPGETLRKVHAVRTIDDILQLRPDFVPGCRLVIIGGGYVGLEVAAVAVKLGLQVTVLEAQPRVLARVTAPELSVYYERVHRGHGVDVRTGVAVQALQAGAADEQGVSHVVLSDGSRLDAELVVYGVGLLPNVELAQAAGLAVDNGIVVDEHAQTSDPHILAAGDCANHFNPFLGRQVRLESVPSALEQARVAAATICGQPRPPAAAPWFWSEQYDLKLQIVGLSQGHDRLVVRGDMAGNRFAAFYLRQGLAIAADVVNMPQEFMWAKRLVAARATFDAELLADPAVPLKSLLEGLG